MQMEIARSVGTWLKTANRWCEILIIRLATLSQAPKYLALALLFELHFVESQPTLASAS